MKHATSIQKTERHLASVVRTVRGQKVLIDADLASMYGVPTRRLNEQVKRNKDRFPEDFMFRLTAREFRILMSQIATSSPGYGGRRKLPFAFTEYGAIMAANILKSNRAIRMSIVVVRTFVELRRSLLVDRELAKWLRELELKLAHHDYDIRTLFKAIGTLLSPKEKPGAKMGFDVR